NSRIEKITIMYNPMKNKISIIYISALWILMPVVMLAEKNGPARQDILIQREAHLLVERLTREYPQAKFTFVLTNEPETGDLVARNLENLYQHQKLLEKIRAEEERMQEISSSGEILEKRRQELKEEQGRILDGIRKLYLEMAELQDS